MDRDGKGRYVGNEEAQAERNCAMSSGEASRDPYNDPFLGPNAPLGSSQPAQPGDPEAREAMFKRDLDMMRNRLAEVHRANIEDKMHLSKQLLDTQRKMDIQHTLLVRAQETVNETQGKMLDVQKELDFERKKYDQLIDKIIDAQGRY